MINLFFAEHSCVGVGESVKHGARPARTASATPCPFERSTPDNTTVTEGRRSDSSDEDDTNCSFCSTNSSSSSPGDSDFEGDCSPAPPDDPEDGHGSCSVDTDPTADCQGRGHTVTGQGQDPPSPIFSLRWQASCTFRREGGSLRKPGSDVILHVRPDAVKEEGGVEVLTAICADVDHIRQVLDLSDDEEVVTPLAEYWAGQDFRFQHPVSITLPHCLPTDYNLDLLRVYHVTRGQDGHITVMKINQQPKNNSNVLEEGTMPSDESVLSLERGRSFQPEECQLHIITDRFCGYVCTYCHKKVKKEPRCRPQLYVMGSGTVTSTPDSLHHVEIIAHVWDQRINIADFRQVTL